MDIKTKVDPWFVVTLKQISKRFLFGRKQETELFEAF